MNWLCHRITLCPSIGLELGAFPLVSMICLVLRRWCDALNISWCHHDHLERSVMLAFFLELFCSPTSPALSHMWHCDDIVIEFISYEQKQPSRYNYVGPMLIQCWSSVYYVGPTLNKHRANVSIQCDPLIGSHDSQSPHIRKHLCPILWQLWFICHKFIHTIWRVIDQL